MVKANDAEQPIVMDKATFQRLRRVLLKIARRYDGRSLPQSEYEDIQKVIVWMDNIANWQ